MANWNQIKQYMTTCSDPNCGRRTSKQYAKKNGGKCKACVTGQVPASRNRLRDDGDDDRTRMLENGWMAYAREEGHYDHGDY